MEFIQRDRMILTAKQICMERARECLRVVQDRFRKSVGIVYGTGEDGRTEPLGSFIFLSVSGLRYVVTAAHVIDHTANYDLSFSGSEKTVSISGEFKITAKPKGDRLKDSFDFAYLELDEEQLSKFGSDVCFIGADEVSKNRGNEAGRQYLVIGYPISRNKGLKAIEHAAKIARPNGWTYQGTSFGMTVEEAEKRGLNSMVHIFVKFDLKHSGDFHGSKVNSIDPHGVSGGALIDLGRPDLDHLKADAPCMGRLAGVMIELNRQGRKSSVMVALKIEHVINSIKSHT